MEINTVKCGDNEEIIIEYHPEDKRRNDLEITVDMLKNSPVGTEWQCDDTRVVDTAEEYDVYDVIHKWKLAYRDDIGALIRHAKIVMKPPFISYGDTYADVIEYIWYEF